MSRLLLDTHIWLWSMESPERVAPPVRSAVLAADDVVLSVASVWEVGIKHSIGKLPLNGGVRPLVDEAVRALGARILSVTLDHAIDASGLPLHHRDPFDRLLVAQARREALTLVTADGALRAYDVELLWAGT